MNTVSIYLTQDWLCIFSCCLFITSL